MKNLLCNKKIFISALGLFMFLFLMSAFYFLRFHSLKNDYNNKVRELEKSNTALHNMLDGGNSDNWFEKNAMTRYGQDEHLLEVADSLGLKHIRKTNLQYSDNTTDRTSGYYLHGGYGRQDGYPIFIKRGLSEDEEKITIAHEYIHYIYTNSYYYTKDQDLFKSLLKMYGENTWFMRRMLPYVESDIFYIDELLAISCTEIPDRDIHNYVLNWCNRWIDRSKLKMQYY